jgi:hypothetical protein
VATKTKLIVFQTDIFRRESGKDYITLEEILKEAADSGEVSQNKSIASNDQYTFEKDKSHEYSVIGSSKDLSIWSLST